MGTRIFAQSIYTEAHPTWSAEGYGAINDGIRQVYATVLRPDTEVDMHFVPRSTWLTSHAYLEMINNIEIVRGVIDGAESGGYDVAFIRCGNDPGVREARESVTIPVVATSESGMLLACQLGAKFALLGVDEKSGPLVERNLRLYGLDSRAIHRPYRIPRADHWDAALSEAPRWFTDPDYVHDRVIPPFEDAARRCIDDGAEVIVTACALYASLTLAGYSRVTGTEVPVVESVAVGIKNAEMQGDLHRSLGLATSKHRTYQSLVAPEVRDALTAPWFTAAEDLSAV